MFHIISSVQIYSFPLNYEYSAKYQSNDSDSVKILITVVEYNARLLILLLHSRW